MPTRVAPCSKGEQAFGTICTSINLSQVLGEVQPLDLHLWLGGQLLLDALFLHCPPCQVCRSQRASHFGPVTLAHVHLLFKMAHQRCSHHLLPHDPCLLHLLPLHDQPYPPSPTPCSRGMVARCPRGNHRSCCSCAGLRYRLHGNIHHLQLPILLLREPTIRLHDWLCILRHIFHCVLPHVSSH